MLLHVRTLPFGLDPVTERSAWFSPLLIHAPVQISAPQPRFRPQQWKNRSHSLRAVRGAGGGASPTAPWTVAKPVISRLRASDRAAEPGS
jgi:hypothetical protein